MSSKRWALFLSGRGSTAQSMLELLPHLDVALVVSSRAMAPGLMKAKRAGVPTLVLGREIDWETLDQDLRSRRVTNLFLLGFMRLMPENFVQKWAGKIQNIHPSLLPAFPGANAITESLAAKAPMGVTIHHVIPEMDAGPRLLQCKVLIENQQDTQAVFRNVAWTEQRLIRHWGDRV